MKLISCTPQRHISACGHPQFAGWRQHHIGRAQHTLQVCQAAGRESAEERALGRYLRNRSKQLGKILPPNPEAPQPDTALLWGFLSRQLAEGITNQAEVLSRGESADGSSTPGRIRAGAARGAAPASQRGVVIAQPEPLPDAARTVTLPLTLPPPGPELLPASPISDGGRGGAAPGVVHVFWDVESAHPGDRDPRLAAAEVLRVARRLGRVVGCYAYATRPAWAWVPTHFINTYVQAADGSGSGGGGSGGSGGASEAAAAAASGGGSGEGGPAATSRLRCPVCGKPVTPARLERHLKQLHPGTPAATLAAAAIAKWSASPDEPVAAAAAAVSPVAAGAAAAPRGTGAARAAPAGNSSKKKNTFRTGLGAVREYHSSGGQVYRPPAGHQLGLKYVVQREGFEPRVVQNADGAADRALNGGVDRLLAALRAGRARATSGSGVAGAAAGAGPGAGAAALAPCTLLVVSGSRRHGATLSSCRQLGLRTVVVGVGEAGTPGEADAWLSWQLVARGAYRV